METKWDYILAGAGCAGLSLAWQILHDPGLSQKRILLIDSSPKTDNDRTWCFWEKDPGPFEEIVEHRWESAWFHSSRFSKLLSLAPYAYKMIRADRFYAHVKEFLVSVPNVTWQEANIESLGSDENRAYVQTNRGTFYADWVFTSLPVLSRRKAGGHYLLQHFKGWKIETAHPSFDPGQATLMDFRINQENECRFMYVLPVSATEALVEFTVFSGELLEPGDYERVLERYVADFLGIASYQVTGEEVGVIPMYSEPFESSPDKRIVSIGTAGNQTKASTGYTFTRIQRHSATLCKALVANNLEYLKERRGFDRFRLYDSTLLHVLEGGIVPGARIFENLYRYNSPQSLFRFLDEDTGLAEEFRILNTVPVLRFIGPGWKELRKSLTWF